MSLHLLRRIKDIMITQSREWALTFYTAVKRLITEKHSYKASSLAFTSLLGIVPLLTVIVFTLSAFPGFHHFIVLAQQYVVSNFVPDADNSIKFYLDGFIDQASQLPLLGIGFLFVTTIMMIFTIEDALNDIWGLEDQPFKFSDFVVYWTVLIATPLFLGLSLFISTYLFSFSFLIGTSQSFQVKIHLLSLVPLFLNAGLFSALYTIMPNTFVRWSDGLLGGITASLLFELAKKIFAIYIKQFPNYELIYGTLSVIPIFLIWLYISWLIILFGALITHTRFERRLSNTQEIT
jgi:membrane protein